MAGSNPVILIDEIDKFQPPCFEKCMLEKSKGKLTVSRLSRSRMEGQNDYVQIANLQFEGQPLDACRVRIRLGKDFRGDPSAASYLQDCFHAPRLHGTPLIFVVPID